MYFWKCILISRRVRFLKPKKLPTEYYDEPRERIINAIFYFKFQTGLHIECLLGLID